MQRFGFGGMIALALIMAGSAWAQGRASSVSNFVSPDQMNAALGVRLWADTNLWTDNIEETAKRLNARPESSTETESSYLVRPDTVLGIRPEVMKILGKAGQVDAVLIMFANKGDTLGMKPAPEKYSSSREFNRAMNEFMEREKELARTIKTQSDQIESALKNLLGNYDRQRFGEGDKTKEWVKTWRWANHAFLLSEQKDTSLSLRIVPLSRAETRGKAERINDGDLRAELKTRVDYRANGDVIVTQIPMIDQGRKGYCVPTTWARYLQYMGIPADEYVLANAAQTQKGGGTRSSQMLAAVERIVKQNRRAIKTLEGRITLNLVAKYIDVGLPLMWRMYSVGPFEGYGRSADRMGDQTPEVWEKALKEDRKAARQIKIASNCGHTCMIIGYNSKTDEIATSDSWGLQHAEKWYTLEEAQAVSQNEFIVITW